MILKTSRVSTVKPTTVTKAKTAFVIMNLGQACMEGTSTYLEAKLARIEATPLRLMVQGRSKPGSCAEHGYTVQSSIACFPEARLFAREGAPAAQQLTMPSAVAAMAVQKGSSSLA